MRLLGHSSPKPDTESSSEDESRKAAVVYLRTRNTPDYVATPGLEINGVRDINVSVYIDNSRWHTHANHIICLTAAPN